MPHVGRREGGWDGERERGCHPSTLRRWWTNGSEDSSTCVTEPSDPIRNQTDP